MVVLVMPRLQASHVLVLLVITAPIVSGTTAFHNHVTMVVHVLLSLPVLPALVLLAGMVLPVAVATVTPTIVPMVLPVMP